MIKVKNQESVSEPVKSWSTHPVKPVYLDQRSADYTSITPTAAIPKLCFMKSYSSLMTHVSTNAICIQV
jgi:uncharacterized phage-associated protein